LGDAKSKLSKRGRNLPPTQANARVYLTELGWAPHHPQKEHKPPPQTFLYVLKSERGTRTAVDVPIAAQKIGLGGEGAAVGLPRVGLKKMVQGRRGKEMQGILMNSGEKGESPPEKVSLT